MASVFWRGGGMRGGALRLALFAVFMFGFGYAMVPLYYKICEITGINNLLNPQSVEDFRPDANRALRLEFDVNARGLVSMTPNIRLMPDARPGQTYSVIYTLKNLSGRPIRAQAVPSYGPRRAGQWFQKIQCFCFEQLTMAAGETRQAPVVFVVEPSLPEDIAVIALSYTFFEVGGTQQPEEHEHSHDSKNHAAIFYDNPAPAIGKVSEGKLIAPDNENSGGRKPSSSA